MSCEWKLSAICVALGLVLGVNSGFAHETTKSDKSPKSLEAIEAEIESLRVEDVAWRGIAWKTCLLDGLSQSREQQKPVILWVFIDRPIDDERC